MANFKILDDLQQIETALKSVATTAAETAKSTQESAQQITQALQGMQERAVDQIAVLQGYIDKFSGPWKDELTLQLDLIRIGGESVDEFLTKWGQAVVTTEDGAKTIRQILEGIDFKGAAQDVQNLAREILQGSKTIADGLQFLKEKGGVLTAEFVRMVEAFRRGQASLAQVEAALRALKELAGPDSAAGAIGDAIVNGARSGTYG